MKIINYKEPGARTKALIADLEDLRDCLIRLENQPDADNINEAIDMLADYEKAAAQNGKLIAHFQIEEKPVWKSGVWCCPSCGKRIKYHHAHCHWCGKKVGWGGCRTSR